MTTPAQEEPVDPTSGLTVQQLERIYGAMTPGVGQKYRRVEGSGAINNDALDFARTATYADLVRGSVGQGDMERGTFQAINPETGMQYGGMGATPGDTVVTGAAFDLSDPYYGFGKPEDRLYRQTDSSRFDDGMMASHFYDPTGAHKYSEILNDPAGIGKFTSGDLQFGISGLAAMGGLMALGPMLGAQMAGGAVGSGAAAGSGAGFIGEGAASGIGAWDTAGLSLADMAGSGGALAGESLGGLGTSGLAELGSGGLEALVGSEGVGLGATLGEISPAAWQEALNGGLNNLPNITDTPSNPNITNGATEPAVPPANTGSKGLQGLVEKLLKNPMQTARLIAMLTNNPATSGGNPTGGGGGGGGGSGGGGGGVPYDPLTASRTQYESKRNRRPGSRSQRYFSDVQYRAAGGPVDSGVQGLLNGPGTGQSDSIEATIDGHQPARLAREEFVVPADVVSALGDGSTEAGAEALYQMMDRIRVAAHGSPQQQNPVDPTSVLPA
jgi:hypothetical protein